MYLYVSNAKLARVVLAQPGSGDFLAQHPSRLQGLLPFQTTQVRAVRAKQHVLPLGKAFQHYGIWSTACWLLSPHYLAFTWYSHCQGQSSSACAAILPEHPK